MSFLIYDCHEAITKWVFDQLHIGEPRGDEKAIGIGVKDKLIGGVVYSEYRVTPNGSPLSFEMSIATIDKRWINRDNLNALFAYPFIQVNVKRVQATTKEDNSYVRQFLARLGFTFEGLAREAHPLGGNAAVYSMLKHECQWI